MNQPIEGLRDETKIDGRSRAAREARAGVRGGEARPDARPDSVRAAELRAAEIMENLDGSDDYFGDELHIPSNLAPEGWEYHLKRVTFAEKEDRHHQLGLLRLGWTPVPADRHPHLMPEGSTGPIVIKGLMLMEKPKILVDRARVREQRDARDQVRNAEDKLREAPPNTAPRDHEKLPNRAKREWGPGEAIAQQPEDLFEQR